MCLGPQSSTASSSVPSQPTTGAAQTTTTMTGGSGQQGTSSQQAASMQRNFQTMSSSTSSFSSTASSSCSGCSVGSRSVSPVAAAAAAGVSSMAADHSDKQSTHSLTAAALCRPCDPSCVLECCYSRAKMLLHVTGNVSVGLLVGGLVVAFSLYFPFLLAPWAAQETYHFAFWDYDPDISHFDNTIWTYGTDYFLAICMAIVAYRIQAEAPGCKGKPDSEYNYDIALCRSHTFRSRGLLMCYMLSVIAGGLAHQFYTTLESRNSMSFRFLWTLCVGTVAAASGFMGSIGSLLVRFDRSQGVPPAPAAVNKRTAYFNVTTPSLPEWFWVGFGACTVTVVIGGGFSFHRPACDIFIAGITQSPSTFYMMLIFATGLPTATTLPAWSRWIGVVAFILNAPLLPMYPLLVQYTDWSLASVNTLLHTWLLVAWGMQGLALRQVGLALQQTTAKGPTKSAVPILRNNVSNEADSLSKRKVC